MGNSFGLNQLAEMLDKKEDDASPDESHAKRETRSKAPIYSKGMTGFTKQQSLVMDMPVTKDKVTCVLMELEPSQCMITPFNKRVQTLLNENDPTIVSLLNSIKENGQRDPVLAHVVTKDGNTFYEIVYGSRRRFVAELIGKQQGQCFKLKAWVANKVISDVDKKVLADSENTDRANISAWEQGQYLLNVAQQNPSWSQQRVAETEGVTQKTISMYFKMAQMPESIVALMNTPTTISLKSGCKIAKQLQALNKAQLKRLVDNLSQSAPFNSSSLLSRAIEAAVHDGNRKNKLKSVKGEKGVIVNKAGQVKAHLGAHRSIDGQYKIDLFHLSKDEYKALVTALEKILV